MVDIPIKTDEERFSTQHGQLIAVDFRDDTCIILTEPNAAPLRATFEADVADTIARAVRKNVIVFWIGGFLENDDQPVTLRILRVEITAEVESIQQLEAEFAAYTAEHDTAANFRQAWKESQADETRPVSELWDALHV